MAAFFKAPELCQFADESLIIQLGEFVYPAFVERVPDENGLSLKLDGDYRDESLMKIASDQFQILLGALRAWNSLAGKRRDENRPGIGSATVMDEHGGQNVFAGIVIDYTNSDIELYSYNTNLALKHSPRLRNSMFVFGRRDRDSADCYLIFEFAKKELGGEKGISKNLGISGNSLKTLRKSTNNLAAIEGGRHIGEVHTAEWGVNEQIDFVAELLREWIIYLAKDHA